MSDIDRLFAMRVEVSPYAPPDTMLLVDPATYARLREEFMRQRPLLGSAFFDLSEAAVKATAAVVGLHQVWKPLSDRAVREARWREFHHPEQVGTAWWDR